MLRCGSDERLWPMAGRCVFAEDAAKPLIDGAIMARLKQKYDEQVVPAMLTQFGYKNPLQVPKLEKITVNVGLGEATQNIKALDAAVAEIAAITGQKPVITRAKKAIANFKLRAGVP